MTDTEWRERAKQLAGSHVTCEEDAWYSCPLSAEGCTDERQEVCTCGRDKRVEAIVTTLADARRVVWEAAAKMVENLTVMAIAAEQRYRETHAKEELNGVRMSERVEFTLTSHGLTIAQTIRTQAQAQRLLTQLEAQGKEQP